MENTILQITFLYAIGTVVVLFQVAALNRILKSLGWKLIAAGFLAYTVRTIKGMLDLQSQTSRWIAEGRMPDHFTMSQWTNIGLLFLFLLLIIAGFHFIRLSMRKFGV